VFASVIAEDIPVEARRSTFGSQLPLPEAAFAMLVRRCSANGTPVGRPSSASLRPHDVAVSWVEREELGLPMLVSGGRPGDLLASHVLALSL
jgi:hypothetical protein